MFKLTNDAGRSRLKDLLLVFCLLSAAGSANAMMTCALQPGSVAQTVTGSLANISVTAGRDLPLGALLANQAVTEFSNVSVRCSGGADRNVTYVQSFLTNGLALSPWQPSDEGAGKVWLTNVPGVGVAFRNGTGNNSGGGTYLPNTWVKTEIGNPFVLNARLGVVQAFFYKIGNISPGSVSTANFPRFAMTIGGVRLWTFNFSGTMSFVSQTCTTPNQLVILGNRPQSDFVGINTGSPFVDFAIELKNCPAFFGQSRAVAQHYVTSVGNPGATFGSTESISQTSNTIRFQLTPPAGNIHSPGILTLGAPTGGATNATGIGIEIRQRSAPAPIAFNTWLDALSLSNVNANSTQTIPLSARYVQTAAQVTPGQANSSVEFILEYK
ncbi:MAG: fimbrial protein [Pseudomonas sp.]|uniref:fimbrial protein n=1 Tax=Pseudomonas sp. TaxID=306 RepID=UPI003D6FF3E4